MKESWVLLYVFNYPFLYFFREAFNPSGYYESVTAGLFIWFFFFSLRRAFRTRLHGTELQKKLKNKTSVKVLFSQWFSHDENAKIKKVKCSQSGEFARCCQISLVLNSAETKTTSVRNINNKNHVLLFQILFTFVEWLGNGLLAKGGGIKVAELLSFIVYQPNYFCLNF